MKTLFSMMESFLEGLVGIGVVMSGSLMLVFNVLLLFDPNLVLLPGTYPKVIFSIVMGGLVFLAGWTILIRPRRGFRLYFVSGLILLPSIIAILIGNILVMAGTIMPVLWNTVSSGQFMVLGLLFTVILLGALICFSRAYLLWNQHLLRGN